MILHHTIPDFHSTFGPDAFYVLTGYLITFSLCSSLSKHDTPRWKRYFGRRFRNVIPTLFILFFLVQIWEFYTESSADIERNDWYGIMSILQVANWHAIGDQVGRYWESMGQINPFGQMWSLSITEQFFLVWPFIMFIFWKVASKINSHYTFRVGIAKVYRMMATLTGILFLGSACIMPMLFLSGATQSRIFMGTDARFHEYIIGAAAALVILWQHHSPSKVVVQISQMPLQMKKFLLATLSLAAFAFWGFMIYLADGYHEDWLYHGGITILAVGLTVLMLSLSHPANPISKFFAHPFLVSLGAYSYEIYAFHLFVAMIIKQVTPDVDPITFFVTTMVLSSLLSAFVYHAFTYRFRVRKFNMKRLYPAVASLFALAMMLTLWLPYLEDVRLSNLNETISSNLAKNDGSTSGVTLKAQDPEYPEVAFSVSVLGDSISEQYLAIFDTYNQEHQAEIKAYKHGMASCGIFGSDKVKASSGYIWNDLEHCNYWESDLPAYLRSDQPDVVLISADVDVNDQYLNKTWAKPCDANYKERYYAKMDLLDQDVQKYNLETGAHAKVMISDQRLSNGTHTEPDQSTCYNDLITEYANTKPNWEVLDIATLLCVADEGETDSKCRPRTAMDQAVFQPDNTNFTPEGESIIAVPVVNQIMGFLSKND